MQTDLKEKLNKIYCNHIKKSVGSTKFRFSVLGLKILQFHNQKHVNEECLVVAVGTRDKVKLLCAPLVTTSAHGKAIFKVLYYGLDIDVMLAKLF